MTVRRLVPLLLFLAAAGPAAAQPRQVVRGTVVDAATRAPLPGANVVVLDLEPLTGATADAAGEFALYAVPAGRWTLRASFVGFEPAAAEVVVGGAHEASVEVALREQIVEGGEVVVRPPAGAGRPLDDMALVSGRSFTVEQTRRFAGGADDPARMASAFAGVASTGGVSENALSIRGNAPKGVLWRLEGVEIPNPNHFAGLGIAGGGGLTLFSAQLLSDSDVLTGAFPAEYGNALSGVFDVHFRAGSAERRQHAAQLGVLGVEVASEGPFAAGRPASYLFNYRYSTLGLVMPLLPTEARTSYQDLAFKLAFPTVRAGRFELWGLGGLDGQRQPENPDSSTWASELWDRTRFDLDLGAGAVGASHHLLLGADTYLRTTAAATGQRTAWEQQRLSDDLTLEPNLSIRNATGRLVLGTTMTRRMSAGHVLRAGLTGQGLFYDLDVRSAPGDRPPLVSVADGRGTSALVQSFAQSRYSAGRGLTVTVGAHAAYFVLNRQLSVEPRIGLRLEVNARNAFSLGYGLHSQVEDLRFYMVRTPAGAQPNRALRMARAHHVVAGYERRFGEAASVRIEGYAQRLFDVPVIADSSYSLLNLRQDWSFAEALGNEGAGRNEGIELTVERPMRGGWYALVTGSLFRSRFRGGDGVWRFTRYDQRYAVNALAGREWRLAAGRHVLGVNARVVAVGGERRSPVDHAASLEREEVVYDETRAFHERAPAPWLLDLTATWRLNGDRVSHVVALQVKNALAAQDVSYDYDFGRRRVVEVREGYPLPILSYELEF